MKSVALFAAMLMPFAMTALPAVAADATPKDTSLVLNAIDTDHDGTITLAEAEAAANAKFARLDTDKEGTLDASELVGLMSKKTLAKADPDKDHTLDKAEYLSAVHNLFKSADPDNDGTLDAAELDSRAGRDLLALLAY